MAARVARRSGGEPAVRKGPWTLEEDLVLVSYITEHGEGSWDNLARAAGLNRNGKSCRLRWLNYLRPGVRRGSITPAEDAVIRELHAVLGNKWSKIAKHLPGRTDNEIKNYWRTRIQKKLLMATQLQQPRRQPATAATVSDGSSSSSSSSGSGSASQDGSAAGDGWFVQPKTTEPHAYGQGAVAVATGTVKSEGASSSASQDSYAAGDCWFVQPKTEQPAYYYQGRTMAVATGVVKSEGASPASASRKDGSSASGSAWYAQANYPYHSELSSAAAGHLGMAGVDASTAQLFSSDYTDSFWNAINNFWETVPATGAF